MYKTLVKKIGEEAESFKDEKMIILFGENAPEELVDFCYTIEVNNLSNEISEDQYVYFDNNAYKIKKVGTSVNKNLRDLGHITVKFDGSISAEQSGTLYVENKEMPKIQEGTVIKIEN